MFDEAKNAVQIDGNRAPPLLVGHAVDGRIFRRPDAVVGNHDVESSKRGDGRRDQLLRRFRRRKVGLRCPAISRAALADQFIRLRPRRLIVENNLSARRGEHPHRSRADTARASGDESDFRVKRQIHKSPLYGANRQKPRGPYKSELPGFALASPERIIGHRNPGSKSVEVPAHWATIRTTSAFPAPFSGWFS